ncbi:ligase-associated DNA damage response DEXH box helicase [Salibacter sp.]|uniref:ligase-associated DNA damage response DEXH box helicase n=1 Tax=Salibacter sp. TaxID=2010995 RepID=UPI0028706A55|nr:ligase-associated DNA damage response DEXH box helicase [Salibacter sp.]MDR9486658.1 ligase-associated DNA damage response DEXH box helicase [Salibacter sp.]
MAAGTSLVKNWFSDKGWKPFPFQKEAWSAYRSGKNGLINAPTGSGKTYAMLGGIVAEYLSSQKANYKQPRGLQVIWITPIRALSKEIHLSSKRMIEGLDIPWEVSVRTGDTSSKERARQSRKMPQILITTPESLHLLLAQKNASKRFKNLKAVVCDEWHELMGSKRGVMMELALSRLKSLSNKLRVWGISATIGNMEESMEVLLGSDHDPQKTAFIKADIKKELEIISVLPDEVEKFPWSGHLGIKLLAKVVPIINESKTTLIFTNTRSQCEIWYQRILDEDPELAGQIAMHHGSISGELRDWVEDALHDERLKAVVCTSSLDLGVDFRPVETIIQIGGPKGVARFAQRAGRSGHRPGEKSKIYFVPTHSLELIEAAALRKAIDQNYMEERTPYIRSFDVLVQYLTTLAVGDGFYPDETLEQIKSTFSFNSINDDEWLWCLDFITTGGDSLHSYNEYHKVEVLEDNLYKVTSRKVAMRHRLQIGAIVSDAMLTVKFVSGGRIGSIEESFISKLKPGDVFWFAGRSLELVRIKDMVVQVKRSKSKTGKIPSWQGGRMPLSSNLSEMLREKMQEAILNTGSDVELKTIQPLLNFQKERSHVPLENEFLIESFESKEGHHCCMYPFDGRFVHEGIASLIAYRMSLLKPISFSIAVNDYGFELLSDQPVPIQEAIDNNLFTTEHLMDDIQNSINASEMARRRFREIAGISGLVFKGYPGKSKSDRHLQSSSQLFFDVFRDYEPRNLLYKEAFEEAMEFQLEFNRLFKTLERINSQEFILSEPEKPTPFAFPVMVDRLREKFIAESLESRIQKMQLKFE